LVFNECSWFDLWKQWGHSGHCWYMVHSTMYVSDPLYRHDSVNSYCFWGALIHNTSLNRIIRVYYNIRWYKRVKLYMPKQSGLMSRLIFTSLTLDQFNYEISRKHEASREYNVWTKPVNNDFKLSLFLLSDIKKWCKYLISLLRKYVCMLLLSWWTFRKYRLQVCERRGLLSLVEWKRTIHGDRKTPVRQDAQGVSRNHHIIHHPGLQ
jgi:hypothetical protein